MLLIFSSGLNFITAVEVTCYEFITDMCFEDMGEYMGFRAKCILLLKNCKEIIERTFKLYLEYKVLYIIILE